MLTTEQIKKVENNCGLLRDSSEPLFVPFTKTSNYFSNNKTLEVKIDIDFTDCLPGYTYTLDWWNPEKNEDDKILNDDYPSDTWAEAINKWHDISNIKLGIFIYGLKSGIDFYIPLSLFAIEENNLIINNVSARSKDEDKSCIFPICNLYDEIADNDRWTIGIDNIDPFSYGGTPYPHDIFFYLSTNGAVIRVAGGY